MKGADDMEYNRRRLFIIGVLALFTAAMSASLRAATMGDIKREYLDNINVVQSATLSAELLGVAFLGFAFTLFFGSPFIDVIGMRRMLFIAAAGFIGGTALVLMSSIFGDGMSLYWTIWVGMLLNGIGWGCVEATINPMTTALYPDDKTHRLNVLHAWWPAGLVVGGLCGFGLGAVDVDWRYILALVMIPSIIFTFLCVGVSFPKTERAQTGVSFGDMLKETLRRPSFLIWFGAMFLTAASELAPGQWVDLALSQVVGMRGILLLVYVSGLMFVMRHFAGPLVRYLSNAGLLLLSSLFAAVGLYLLSIANSPMMAMIAATVWGVGVCYMWPTMLATVAEKYPRGGSWMIGLMGSAGALSISFVLPQLGKVYDQAKIEAAGGVAQLAELSGAAMDEVLAFAAQESFQAVAVVPLVLCLVFGALTIVEFRKSKE